MHLALEMRSCHFSLASSTLSVNIISIVMHFLPHSTEAQVTGTSWVTCHLYSPHVGNSHLSGSSQESDQPEINSSPEAATPIKPNPSPDNSAHPNSITGPECPKKQTLLQAKLRTLWISAVTRKLYKASHL